MSYTINVSVAIPGLVDEICRVICGHDIQFNSLIVEIYCLPSIHINSLITTTR